VQLGTPAQLYEEPVDAFVADFIGESVLVPVSSRGGRTHLADRELRVRQAAGEGAHLLVIRPERLQLVDRSHEPQPDVNVFRGRVTDVVYEGESVLVHADCGGLMLRVRQLLLSRSVARVPQRGDDVAIALHRNDTIVVPQS
jgi:putative spermidine/putrescine transport system ATP-binding protein